MKELYYEVAQALEILARAETDPERRKLAMKSVAIMRLLSNTAATDKGTSNKQKKTTVFKVIDGGLH